VPQGYNPITLVRQTVKRSRIPDILTPGEINALWHGSGKREQAMISIEYENGLPKQGDRAQVARKPDVQEQPQPAIVR